MDHNDFRNALSRWASSVAVVCTVDAQQHLVGFTATSFASVSLDPPLVLFCLGAESTRAQAFGQANAFTINFLSDGQRHLAERFAAQGPSDYADVPTMAGEGPVPLLKDCLAALECRLETRHVAGDHHIYVCRVQETVLQEAPRQEAPLLHFQRAYHQLAP